MSDQTPENAAGIRFGNNLIWNTLSRKNKKSAFDEYIEQWLRDKQLTADSMFRFELFYESLSRSLGRNFYQAPLAQRNEHIEMMSQALNFAAPTEKKNEFQAATGIVKVSPKSFVFIPTIAPGQTAPTAMTENDAMAIVLLAVNSQKLIGKRRKFFGKRGATLTGSPAEIALLQAAITQVNPFLPDAQKIFVRNGIGPLDIKRGVTQPTQAPPSSSSLPDAEDEAVKTKTSDPENSQEEPKEEVDLEHEEDKKKFYATEAVVEIKKSINEIFVNADMNARDKDRAVHKILKEHRELLTGSSSMLDVNYTDDAKAIFKLELDPSDKNSGAPTAIYFSQTPRSVEIIKNEPVVAKEQAQPAPTPANSTSSKDTCDLTKGFEDAANHTKKSEKPEQSGAQSGLKKGPAPAAPAPAPV